jgi:hypothetical protein
MTLPGSRARVISSAMSCAEVRRTAAAYLRGQATRGPIASSDVAYWRHSQLLLPIASVIERRGGSFRELLSPADAAAYTTDLHLAVAVEAGERRVITEVWRALARAGIPAILLKGAALGYTVYSSPWLRARSDIDVLVPEGALDRVERVLLADGFSALREVRHPLISRQRHFVRSNGFRVAVDVHDALVNPVVLRTLPRFDCLFGRAKRLPQFASGVTALATPDAMLHAAVHRVAHHNSSTDLLWLYDLHLLAAHMQPPDWTTLVETATESRVCSIVKDSLRQLQNTLGDKVPVDVVSRLDAVRDEPSAALLGGHLSEWRLQWINFKSLPGVRTRLEFLHAHLAPPAGEVALERRSPWRRPMGYVSRAASGARKWMAPISRAR